MATRSADLWTLALHRLHIDVQELADAIEDEARQVTLDFRTRLLIRDALAALGTPWGQARLAGWLARSPVGPRLKSIRCEEIGEPGFPFLEEQVVETTKPETVRQFLRELGQELQRPERLVIGGSIALIVPGYLSRRTQDIDVVDEVPESVRALGERLNKLMTRHRLRLGHFQSRYLPQGWQARVHALGAFARLQVYLVDIYDVFLSKLFSAREKDRDDLRAILSQVDKDILSHKLTCFAAAFLAEAKYRELAEKNWYILYGEPLPA